MDLMPADMKNLPGSPMLSSFGISII